MILDELAAYAHTRVDEAEKEKPLGQVRDEALAKAPGTHRFARALSEEGLSFICELKKASPSKGVISERFPYRSILHAYMKGGADAISCLTEPKWFLGSDEIFEDVRESTALPLLRKDFTVSEYQIYQSHVLGADAVLLIVRLLDADTLKHYLAICAELGIDALVETHDEAEIEKAVAAGAKIIGVNNRNLADFSVDLENAQRLRELIPDNVLYVAESGIKTVDDVRSIAATGADGILMGEALMRSDNPERFLFECREAATEVRDSLGIGSLGLDSLGRF